MPGETVVEPSEMKLCVGDCGPEGLGGLRVLPDMPELTEDDLL